MNSFSAKYFGPVSHRKADEEQVETPVGKVCLLCDETITEGDIGTINSANQILHYECQLRSVIGSVLHQQGRCSCTGVGEEEDSDISYRQSALEAVAFWSRNAALD